MLVDVMKAVVCAVEDECSELNCGSSAVDPRRPQMKKRPSAASEGGQRCVYEELGPSGSTPTASLAGCDLTSNDTPLFLFSNV